MSLTLMVTLISLASSGIVAKAEMLMEKAHKSALIGWLGFMWCSVGSWCCSVPVLRAKVKNACNFL
jgi:hypothetical protein